MFGTGWALAIALTVQAAGASPPVRAGRAAAAGQWTDDRPITHLVPNLFRDIKKLPSSDTALWLAAGGAGALAVKGTDARLADWSARSGESSYTAVGDRLGDGWVHSGGAVLTYAIGKWTHSAQAVHVGSDLIRAQALNGLLTAAIKAGADRTRPTGARHAFPSGHTSATFASAAVLHAHYGWKAGAPAFATAAFVGWSRVRDRQHWMSDVAFGGAIGVVSGRTVARTHSRRVTVVPAKTKGGFSLMFFVNSSHKIQVTGRK